MTLPAPTKQYRTQAEYDAEWTAQGGIATSTDQWGNTNYFPSDGGDDALLYTASQFFDATNTSGVTKIVVSGWMKIPTGTQSPDHHFFSQWTNSGNRGTFLFSCQTPSTGRIVVTKGPDSANAKNISGTTDLRDDKLHHVAFSWDQGAGTPMALYVDGVNEGGTIGGFGSESDDWPATFTALAYIYRRQQQPEFQDFDAYRHKVWLGVAATDSDISEEYSAELAAIPSTKRPTIIIIGAGAPRSN